VGSATVAVAVASSGVGEGWMRISVGLLSAPPQALRRAVNRIREMIKGSFLDIEHTSARIRVEWMLLL
jgi:hypothetical protein